MEYLLFVFAKHDKQEDFIKLIAEEIATIADCEDIKYYFGPESGIFTFKSLDESEEVKSFFQTILGCSGIVYFLSPFEPDKMSYWVDSEINKHLFNIDDVENKQTSEDTIEFQKFIFGSLEHDQNKIAEIDFDMFDEEDEVLKSKKKPKDPTLNELLDKINEKGIKSLNKKEIELLNNYSK